MSVPQSQELRLHAHETNDLETVAMTIFEGGTTELSKGLKALELIIEGHEAHGVRVLGAILKDKLMADGYIVMQDIEDAVAASLDVLGYEHEVQPVDLEEVLDDAA